MLPTVGEAGNTRLIYSSIRDLSRVCIEFRLRQIVLRANPSKLGGLVFVPHQFRAATGGSNREPDDAGLPPYPLSLRATGRCTIEFLEKALHTVGLGPIGYEGRSFIKSSSFLAWCVVSCLFGSEQVFADSGQFIVGRATVIDGDTIDIRGERIRLGGVDAPEFSQLCLDGSGREYRCGSQAANALSDVLATSTPVSCTFIERDAYKRFVGECRLANGASVQEWLVSSGFALDWVRYSGGKYAALQEEARIARRGIWQGEFQPPWEWRAGNRGRKKQKEPATQAASSERSGDCVIKGNISSKGVRIFHVPGQRDYQKTKISEGKGERWFCSAEEAVATGWRPAAR